MGNKRILQPKELPSCTIPLVLTAFTRQLGLLATTLIQKEKPPTFETAHLGND